MRLRVCLVSVASLDSVWAETRRLALPNRVRLGEEKQLDAANGQLCSIIRVTSVVM